MERFLVNPQDEANFTLGGDRRAFARYACAGTGALHRETAFLDFAQSYATGAQGIVKPGGNSFAEQWAKYKQLQKPLSQLVGSNKPGGTPQNKTSDQLYKECIDELTGVGSAPGILDFRGMPASDTTDEVALGAISPVIAAVEALFKALDKAATDGLTAVNAVEARKKLAEYVNTVHEKFQGSISSELSPDRLDDAWKRRKAYSLWAPYLTFTHILRLKAQNASDYEIKDYAVKLESELGPYDVIRGTKPPSAIVKGLSAAENAVYSAATDNSVSLEAIAQLLDGIIADINSVVSDYADVEKKGAAAITATK